MAKKDLNTEQKILIAAKAIFIEKGLEGARMQEIADEAGINKALLHYYYRTKDKLFGAVFEEAFNKMIPQVIELLKADLPLFEKITRFVENYIGIFIENPFIPGFVLHELNRNPDRVVGLISNMGMQPEIFIQQVQDEIEKGSIIPIDPRQLIVNMLAMCIFPYIAKPILNPIIFDGRNETFIDFIEERKRAVPEFIINSIKK